MRISPPTSIVGNVLIPIDTFQESFARYRLIHFPGLPLPSELTALLGHTQVQTMARYAHLAADPVKAAAERVTSNIAFILDSGQNQEPMPR